MKKEKKKKRILMIEDDIFLRKVYRDQFTRNDIEFIEATNGVEGMSKAQSEKPDLILLDLMLPRKNGFDVLRDLKKNSKTKKIPVIILTNLSQDIDVTEGLALGAVDYLVKTDLRLSDVVEKVKKWLK